MGNLEERECNEHGQVKKQLSATLQRPVSDSRPLGPTTPGEVAPHSTYSESGAGACRRARVRQCCAPRASGSTLRGNKGVCLLIVPWSDPFPLKFQKEYVRPDRTQSQPAEQIWAPSTVGCEVWERRLCKLAREGFSLVHVNLLLDI